MSRPASRGRTVSVRVEQDSQFRFIRSQHLPEVTALQAKMDGFTYDKHAHEEYAFGVTLSGSQDFFSNGSFHRSPPGKVIQLSPDEVHDGHSGGDDPLSYVMLYIHPGQIEPLMTDAAGRTRIGDIHFNETLLDDPLLRDQIIGLVRLIADNVGSRIEQEHALFQIASRMVQRVGSFEMDAVSRRPDVLLERAKDFIHDCIDADLSLEDISAAAHLSKYHFLRLFRRQFGITPHQYVINCRINAARSALEAGESVNDVVHRYGFSDLSHFNRRFKRIYGMTPTSYQQSIGA
ncbi:MULTISPECIES: helix-turn-helix transcriptional regulator [Marinobacter]|uniref:helix-turn-helix transcriptional regulator n=1 Tax=Marinobacter TaxID=2742 RepID=UPI001A9CF242|nr:MULTISPECIES: AraC family transcriptional regulator [Marinobacter]